MRILMLLIISILVSALVPYILAKASRGYAFGFIIMIGGGLLGSYFHFSEPLNLSDYQIEEIRYQKIYLKESADKIVIISGDKEYGLSRALLKFSGNSNSEEVITKLRMSSNAKIWVGSRDFIAGIESEKLNIPPEVGLEYDNNNIRSSAVIGWIPAILGLLVIITNFFNVIVERRQS